MTTISINHRGKNHKFIVGNKYDLSKKDQDKIFKSLKTSRFYVMTTNRTYTYDKSLLTS